MKALLWRRYRLALGQQLPRLLAISFVVSASAYGIAWRVGPVTEVHYSYLISWQERERSGEYQFDGYYALQATDLFSSTLAHWITTPEVINAAYERAGLRPPTNDPRLLVKQITATKSAPQLVEVTVKGGTPRAAQALALGLQAEMQQNVARYHDAGDPVMSFRAMASIPWTGTREAASELIAVATFLTTLILGCNAVLLRASLQEINDGT